MYGLKPVPSNKLKAADPSCSLPGYQMTTAPERVLRTRSGAEGLLLLGLLFRVCLGLLAEKGSCVMRVEGIELHRLLTGVGQGDVDATILRKVNGGEVAHDLLLSLHPSVQDWSG